MGLLDDLIDPFDLRGVAADLWDDLSGARQGRMMKFAGRYPVIEQPRAFLVPDVEPEVFMTTVATLLSPFIAVPTDLVAMRLLGDERGRHYRVRTWRGAGRCSYGEVRTTFAVAGAPAHNSHGVAMSRGSHAAFLTLMAMIIPNGLRGIFVTLPSSERLIREAGGHGHVLICAHGVPLGNRLGYYDTTKSFPRGTTFLDFRETH